MTMFDHDGLDIYIYVDDDDKDKLDNYDDDIYIMMKCLFVCHEKSSLS